MTDDAFEEEPVVTLLDGRVVLRAVYEIVRRLRAIGHTITADGEGGAVRVEPPTSDDLWHVLDSQWDQTAAILENESDDPVVSMTYPGSGIVQ